MTKNLIFKRTNTRIYRRENPGEWDTVVIRNMEPSTDVVEVKICLERLGYRVMRVRNSVNQLTGIALPIFFVRLHKAPINETIYNVKYLAHQVVVVEKYVQGPDVLRCTRCQGLNHTKEMCTKSPACAWCSGRHFTVSCKLVKDYPPTCARCGGCHPSSYKGCKIYKKAQERACKSPDPLSEDTSISSLSSPSPTEFPEEEFIDIIEAELSEDEVQSNEIQSNEMQSKEIQLNNMQANEIYASYVQPIEEQISDEEDDVKILDEVNSESSESNNKYYPINWEPPLEEPMTERRLKKLVKETMEHLMSMNEDLRLQLAPSTRSSELEPFKIAFETEISHMIQSLMRCPMED